MNEEDLKKQTLQFRELVGDELFWFTMSRNDFTDWTAMRCLIRWMQKRWITF